MLRRPFGGRTFSSLASRSDTSGRLSPEARTWTPKPDPEGPSTYIWHVLEP